MTTERTATLVATLELLFKQGFHGIATSTIADRADDVTSVVGAT